MLENTRAGPEKWLIGARALMAGADALVEVGIALLILRRSGGNIGVLGMVLALPWAAGLLSQLSAIGWIDRLPKKFILIVGSFIRAGLVLILALIPWVGADAFFYFLLFVVASPSDTALHAMIPAIAPNAEGIRAINNKIQQWEPLAQGSAYVLAGVLFVGRFLTLGMGLAALPLLVAGLAALRLPTTPLTLNSHISNPTTSLWQTFRQSPMLIGLTVISFGAAFLVLGANVLLAPAMRALWHQPTAHYAWALLAIAAGQALGGYYLTHGARLSFSRQILIGFTGFIAGLTILAMSQSVWLALPTLIFMGAVNALFSRGIAIEIQSSISQKVLGRVLSARGLIMIIGAGLGTLAAGWIGKLAGVRTTYEIWTVAGMVGLLAVWLGFEILG